jgi:hypothetical protein
MKTPLCELSTYFGTDKGYPHRYTPIYYEYLKPRADSILRVLEIGICVKRDLLNGRTGASLYMWQEFFPNANIFGIDIDPHSMVNVGRIKSALANQTDPATMAAAFAAFGDMPFDVVVDDGSHAPQDQVAAALITLPHLDPRGFYFIEDIYVDPAEVRTAIDAVYPGRFTYEVFEGAKPLPEGYGRRQWGGPPAGEILMLIRYA